MKIKLLLLAVATLLLASCSQHFYMPALFNNDISYLPRPASFDSTKNALYITGGGGFGQGADALNDVVGFGTLELSGGHDLNGANFAYSVFGFAGSISGSSNNDNYNGRVSSNVSNYGSKSFSGLGARFAASAYQKIDNKDFRFIGIEAAFSKEFGDYAAFRKQVYGNPDAFAYTNTRLFTLGLTSEIIFHSNNHLDYQFGFRGFAGRTFGDYNGQARSYNSDDNIASFQSVYLSFSYFMQLRRFITVVDIAATPSDLYYFPQVKVKLGYRF